MAKRKGMKDIWVLIVVLICILLIGMELIENVATEIESRSSSDANTQNIALVQYVPGKIGGLG